MKIETKTITTAQAQEWLDGVNTSNRKLSRATVGKYAADMAAGKWRNTHQNAIAFYEDGGLADGQHRLAAVVASGVNVEMFVATGISRNDAFAIDQGRSRSFSDGLIIGGMVDDQKYINHKVSIVKMLWHVEVKADQVLSVSKVSDLIDEFKDAIDFSISHTHSAMNGIGVASVRAALSTAYCCVPFSVADRFARVLASGMSEGQEDISIIRLRNWLVQGRSNSIKERIETYKTVLRVLHAYERGDILGTVRKTDRLFYNTGVLGNE